MKKRHLLLLFLSLLPFAALLCGMVSFFVDVPFVDAWSFVPYLQKSHDGALSLHALLEQHNESRLFLQRLLILGLARASNWNSAWELASIAAFAFGVFALLSIQAFREEPGSGGAHWLPILFSILVFSPVQYECWTFGFTVAGYMNIFFAVAGLFTLATRVLRVRHLFAAAALGLAATYSYANGIIFWPAGLLLICMRMLDARRGQDARFSLFARRVALFLWLLAAALTIFFYFHGYRKPGLHPSLLSGFQQPCLFAAYLLSFMGSPIANAPCLPFVAPIILGGAGLLVFFAASAAWLFLPKTKLSSLPFWIALGGFSLMTGIAASLGRSAWGVTQSLESRYTIFSSLFWIAVVRMAAALMRRVNSALKKKRARAARLVFNAAIFGAAAVCFLLFLFSARAALSKWRERASYMAATRDELLTDRPDEELLSRCFPSVPFMLAQAAWLSENQLSLFRGEQAFLSLSLREAAGAETRITECNLPPNRSFSGHAFGLAGTFPHPQFARRVKAVALIDSNNSVLARATLPRGSRSTWRMSLNSRKLPAGVSELSVVALTRENKEAYRLGRIELDVIPFSEIKSIFHLETFSCYPEEMWGYLDTIRPIGSLYEVSGWARSPVPGELAEWIGIADINTNFLAVVKVTEERQDVADHFRDQSLLMSGWRTAIPESALENGKGSLSAYLLLPKEARAVRLNSLFESSEP